MSVFRGREDVYAKRWESWDEKKNGYFPVHTDRTKSAYASLTEAVVEHNLRDAFIDRFEKIVHDTSCIGWGFHDSLEDFFRQNFPDVPLDEEKL